VNTDEAIFLHESHSWTSLFKMMLAIENKRFLLLGKFTDFWRLWRRLGLYCGIASEKEIGIVHKSYQYFGMLTTKCTAAIRLVGRYWHTS